MNSPGSYCFPFTPFKVDGYLDGEYFICDVCSCYLDCLVSFRFVNDVCDSKAKCKTSVVKFLMIKRTT